MPRVSVDRRWWTAGATVLALIAIAANSLLCRAALGAGQIDAASYTSLRLGSGALVLWLIVVASGRGDGYHGAGSWSAAAMLFGYAIAFSFAYISLDAGTGALILFGAVQATMVVGGLVRGERPSGVEWTGLVIAGLGLIYLVSPGLTAPDPFGAVLMAIAGMAWGGYSLRGLGGGDPVAVTASNFLRATPFALAVSLVAIADIDVSTGGAWLAILSGGLASGVGYVVWYAALKGLNTTRAAVVQLAVPALAAFGGVVFLAEPVTTRLLIAAIMILGGIALAVWRRGVR